MKIENKNKRKAMSTWLGKTGNGMRRRYGHATVKALEYMHYKPYGGAYEQKHTDTSVQE